MKRTIWISMAIIFVVAFAWMALMRIINTRVTQLSVQVAGNVERVVFYQAAEPERILAEILPQGQAVEMPVILPNTAQRSLLRQGAPAQYYFVAEQAGQRYKSPPICCETGIASRDERLIIRGLEDWEKPGQ